MTMKKQAFNPYLPSWEYIPDGEPHVFGGRVYVFGSHDRAGGTAFCQEDYVAWSAPADNLGDWRCHGIIYRKEQDPHNREAKKELWAPDVCRGADGRYYLYYCRAFVPEFGIAVSEKPEGPYEFYDYARDERGEIWRRDLPFDPGILYEDKEHIWLYSGFGADPLPEGVTIGELRAMDAFKAVPEEALEGMAEQIRLLAHPSENCSCLRLAADMKTVIAASPVLPSRRNAKGSDFEAHPFFEASSIRKIGDTYYLVYSSFQGHELCYATSKYPDRGFQFGGVVISNADLGYQGNAKARAYHANNHGGMVEANRQWYIFYHRHTHGTMFSRQGCAEPIRILKDGSIQQAEMTSCGLNGAPLPASGTYPAHICCNLIGPDGAGPIGMQNGLPDGAPYIAAEAGEDAGEGPAGQCARQYIRNLRKGAVCGAKYFQFGGEAKATLLLRGKGSLHFILDDENREPVCSIAADSETWRPCSAAFPGITGVRAVYFKAAGAETCLDFSEFRFESI